MTFKPKGAGSIRFSEDFDETDISPLQRQKHLGTSELTKIVDQLMNEKIVQENQEET